MSNPIISQTIVRDLVPFGNPGQDTGFYALRLSRPHWESWQPGQFVMLRPHDGAEGYLWARPFSICHVTPLDLVIFFQVVGRATRQLAGLAPGAVLDIWGPLGNPLHMDPQKDTLLLAGGIGIAPFVGYAHTHTAAWNITLQFGHRMPLDCYPFESLNEKVSAYAYLERNADDREAFIAAMDYKIQQHASKGLVLACGPMPFLRTVQQLARKHKAKAQLCLETIMACGIGACLGCVVKAAPSDTDGASQSSGWSQGKEMHHVQSCVCGPSFWADSVDLG